MALNFDQAVEEEKRKNILRGIPAWNTTASNVPTSTITQPAKEQSNQKPILQSISSNEPKVQTSYEPPTNLMLPKINELPNAQRDSELGKMNVRTDGDTTTYNIGSNTLSYNLDDKDKRIKTNLARINQMIDSGVEVSPEQMNRINNIRQQAGYLRGGTDRQISNVATNGMQRVGNMDVTFDSSVTPAVRERFLENPVAPTAQMDRYDKRQLSQIQTAPEYNDPRPLMPRNRTNRAMAEYNQARGEWSARQIAREELKDKLSIDKDKNRIDEMGVIAENKLRDIQGKVMQEPPLKESALKPMVIEEPDPNDPLGNIKRQRIMIPNAEGTGYVDGMSGQTQTQFATPKPATVNKLLKMRDSKDPNLSAAEEEYKMRFGTLPY